eukprot:TRINITY_DN80262_c0_g1_i1.p1 TRINITY_DN80262_c0_g1~~TRINITY_DN80262_c0_g1_i1.p1  ORF type:complete len:492 (+),score=85.66 TRINITY_DN80262_c0_g1_i1:25-1500(+)
MSFLLRLCYHEGVAAHVWRRSRCSPIAGSGAGQLDISNKKLAVLMKRVDSLETQLSERSAVVKQEPERFQNSPAPEAARTQKDSPAEKVNVSDMQQHQDFAAAVCSISKGHAMQIRTLPHEQREEIIRALAPIVERPPAPLKVRHRPQPVHANCKMEGLFPTLLSGTPRKKPVMLIDVPTGMGGGPELDFLELRLMELEGIVDYTVVAESSFNFRGDQKPRHYARNLDRFQQFESQIVQLDLDTCKELVSQVARVRMTGAGRMQDQWPIQNAQRRCLWLLLLKRYPDMADSTLAIFSDLDEIPSAQVMLALKFCELAPTSVKEPHIIQMKQAKVEYNLRQAGRDGTCKTRDWLQGVVVPFHLVKERVLRMQGTIQLRYKLSEVRQVEGGLHLSNFGNLGQINAKGLQHGEGGELYFPIEFACHLKTSPQDLAKLQATLRDNPVSILRAWEHRNEFLPQKCKLERRQLEECGVPWALLENPSRYPAFWGVSG